MVSSLVLLTDRDGHVGHVQVTASGASLAYGKPGLKNEGFLAWGKKPAW